MTIAQATALLHYDTGLPVETTWADLGAGRGTFTLALANRLSPGSVIYAIDSDERALAELPDAHNAVTIRKCPADFVRDALPFQRVDGFLMANALHYVREKEAFLETLNPYLTETGCFLIVEYDTDTPSPPWVPYPVSFQTLTPCFDGLASEPFSSWANAGRFTAGRICMRPGLNADNKTFFVQFTLFYSAHVKIGCWHG